MCLALITALLSAGDYGSPSLTDVLPGVAGYDLGDGGLAYPESVGDPLLPVSSRDERPNLVHVRFGEAGVGISLAPVGRTTVRSLRFPTQVDQAIVELILVDVVGLVLLGVGSNEGFEYEEVHVSRVPPLGRAQDDEQIVGLESPRAENLPHVRTPPCSRPLHPPLIRHRVPALVPNYRLPPFNHGPTIESARSGVKKRS